jgi:hypothetical protein
MLGAIVNMSPVTASDIFAISQNSANLGRFKCHWCGTKCDDSFRHDDPPPIPFQVNKSLAKCFGEHWICHGCWLWRRLRVTVTFIDNTYKDSQCAQNHSWWITDKESKAINQSCKSLLPNLLLNPPNKFVLSLLDDTKIQNLLHLSVSNDISVIEANTPLRFTINNVVSEYTVYDLKTALEDEEASRSPGVRLLLNWIGPVDWPQIDKRRSVGKPKEIMVSEHAKRVITLSGKEKTE